MKAITLQTAKYIVNTSTNVYSTSFQYPNLHTETYYSPTGVTHLSTLIEKENLWLCDEWGHLGYAIVTCIQNEKLVKSYCAGKIKLLDNLIGITIKNSNMTLQPELVKELLPKIIERWFRTANEQV
jgi:Asp-tRNA(Asn)/Glu-tRNA(Gln) amidotransferase B subunit